MVLLPPFFRSRWMREPRSHPVRNLAISPLQGALTLEEAPGPGGLFRFVGRGPVWCMAPALATSIGRREARINGHFIRVNTVSGHGWWGQEGQARELSTKGFFIRLSIRHEKRSLKAPFDSVHSCSHRLTGPPRPCRWCAAECGTPPDAGTGRGHRAPPRSAPARRRRARG